MTEASLPDLCTDGPLARRGRSVGHGRYLPSPQVLDELAVLGLDLGRLAADLQDRLSEPSDDGTDLASRPARGNRSATIADVDSL